jgi:prepilin-type N-terminal cleavage/methylation domain-containing protein
MHKKSKAFTLIELLVAVAIIGILTGFIFVSMNGAVNSAKDSRRQADLSTISKAILEYYVQHNNVYPYTASTSTCNLCNNDSCSNPCTGFYANIQPYMANIPLDPNGSTYYTYTYSATPKFVLKATLSNTYTYQYDSISGFSTISYSSTCAAATNAQVSCSPITISSTEEACQCAYLSGAGTTSWTVPNGVTSAQVLVVAGGGGGGGPVYGVDGGSGGGGGLLTGTLTGLSGTFSITVGAGGAGGANGANDGTNGVNSSFGTYIANGGGGGGAETRAGKNGGSGGGDGGNSNTVGVANQTNQTGAYGTLTGYGYNGGDGSGTYAGGGGGAAGAGGNPTVGGAGMSVSITGTATTYAAGGNRNYLDGTAGTGNGGGSPGDGYNHGYAGGSGVIVIRYTHP